MINADLRNEMQFIFSYGICQTIRTFLKKGRNNGLNGMVEECNVPFFHHSNIPMFQLLRLNGFGCEVKFDVDFVANDLVANEVFEEVR